MTHFSKLYKVWNPSRNPPNQSLYSCHIGDGAKGDPISHDTRVGVEEGPQDSRSEFPKRKDKGKGRWVWYGMAQNSMYCTVYGLAKINGGRKGSKRLDYVCLCGCQVGGQCRGWQKFTPTVPYYLTMDFIFNKNYLQEFELNYIS